MDDEVSFGPKRESQLSPGRRRAFTVGVAGALAAGAAAAVIVAGPHHVGASPRPTSQPAAFPAPTDGLLPVTCQALHTVRPNLAALPVGMRPGALRVVMDESSSVRCTVLRPAPSAG